MFFVLFVLMRTTSIIANMVMIMIVNCLLENLLFYFRRLFHFHNLIYSDDALLIFDVNHCGFLPEITLVTLNRLFTITSPLIPFPLDHFLARFNRAISSFWKFLIITRIIHKIKETCMWVSPQAFVIMFDNIRFRDKFLLLNLHLLLDKIVILEEFCSECGMWSGFERVGGYNGLGVDELLESLVPGGRAWFHVKELVW